MSDEAYEMGYNAFDVDSAKWPSCPWKLDDNSKRQERRDWSDGWEAAQTKYMRKLEDEPKDDKWMAYAYIGHVLKEGKEVQVSGSLCSDIMRISNQTKLNLVAKVSEDIEGIYIIGSRG